MKRLVKALLITLMLTICTTVWAVDVSLQWDANTETDLGGYLLYYKIDGTGPSYDGISADQGTSPIDVGNVTEFTITGLRDLVPLERYRFVVTAYSLVEELESGFSNETDAGVPKDPKNLKILPTEKTQ